MTIDPSNPGHPISPPAPAPAAPPASARLHTERARRKSKAGSRLLTLGILALGGYLAYPTVKARVMPIYEKNVQAITHSNAAKAAEENPVVAGSARAEAEVRKYISSHSFVDSMKILDSKRGILLDSTKQSLEAVINAKGPDAFMKKAGQEAELPAKLQDYVEAFKGYDYLKDDAGKAKARGAYFGARLEDFTSAIRASTGNSGEIGEKLGSVLSDQFMFYNGASLVGVKGTPAERTIEQLASSQRDYFIRTMKRRIEYTNDSAWRSHLEGEVKAMYGVTIKTDDLIGMVSPELRGQYRKDMIADYATVTSSILQLNTYSTIKLKALSSLRRLEKEFGKANTQFNTEDWILKVIDED